MHLRLQRPLVFHLRRHIWWLGKQPSMLDTPKTGQDYDHGDRRLVNGRIYPDGRVVDSMTGMTPHQLLPDFSACGTVNGFLDCSSKESPSELLPLTWAGHRHQSVARCTAIQWKDSTTPMGPIGKLLAEDYVPALPNWHRRAVACPSHPKTGMGHSPEQISHRLGKNHPNDPTMRVCHETIYQAIYIHARGGLKREVQQPLRTGRTHRKPATTIRQRPPNLRDPMIHRSDERPQVEDRAVPAWALEG